MILQKYFENHFWAFYFKVMVLASALFWKAWFLNFGEHYFERHGLHWTFQRFCTTLDCAYLKCIFEGNAFWRIGCIFCQILKSISYYDFWNLGWGNISMSICIFGAWNICDSLANDSLAILENYGAFEAIRIAKTCWAIKSRPLIVVEIMWPYNWISGECCGMKLPNFCVAIKSHPVFVNHLLVIVGLQLRIIYLKSLNLKLW